MNTADTILAEYGDAFMWFFTYALMAFMLIDLVRISCKKPTNKK